MTQARSQRFPRNSAQLPGQSLASHIGCSPWGGWLQSAQAEAHLPKHIILNIGYIIMLWYITLHYIISYHIIFCSITVLPTPGHPSHIFYMGGLWMLTPFAVRLTQYASRLTPHALRLAPCALRLALVLGFDKSCTCSSECLHLKHASICWLLLLPTCSSFIARELM